ncbi:MAG: hypothetical protein R3B45_14300 [Bdellovibrionota bacterium]
MEKQGKKTKPQKTRKRNLNVVYFVDSGKTKSFTIPLIRFNGFFALGMFVLAWALVSTWFLYYLVSENIYYRTRYKSALTTIFAYQGRYDGVYEKAYPNLLTQNLLADSTNKEDGGDVEGDTSKSDSGVKKDLNEAKSSEVKREAPKVTSTNLQATSPSEKIQDNAEQPLASEPEGWTLAVTKSDVSKDPKGFELSFSIKNLSASRKASGYVWAVASFLKESGETVYFSAPSHLKVDQYGKVVDATRSHRFSIRNFKRKNFSFLAPEGLSGELTGIEIGLMTSGGDSRITKLSKKIEYDYAAMHRTATKSETNEGDKDLQEKKEGEAPDASPAAKEG